MALQTSGAISLNDIHVEAGGTTGTSCTLNDSDIRGLIGKSSGAQMSFNEWYGASSSLDTQTVTVGYLAGGQYAPDNYGYTSSIGSISDGTFNVKSGATINSMVGLSTNSFNLQIAGVHANSGWSYFTTDGGTTKFYRTNATFSTDSINSTTSWSWLTNQNGQGSFNNPLGTTSGATKTVVFL